MKIRLQLREIADTAEGKMVIYEGLETKDGVRISYPVEVTVEIPLTRFEKMIPKWIEVEVKIPE